ncbi:MAG: precorrin-6A/cobalt-precorrin-6A reductase, partial [Bacillota bacterium]|nr:precorrin-6A/cobalt-precorrin-6A reductase [Bacillota bacterium]
TVFTATSYGSSLIKEKDNLKTKTGPLTREEIEEVLKEIEAEKIVDATHPYAENISKNLIEVSKNLNIPYFRYERRGVNINKNSKNILFSNYKEIVN